jgi:hypothetical protein
MPDKDVARMYGVTCPNENPQIHPARLGKEILSPDAPVSELQRKARAAHGPVDSTVCPVCGTGISFSPDQVRFVDDSEWPPEHEVDTSSDWPESKPRK